MSIICPTDYLELEAPDGRTSFVRKTDIAAVIPAGDANTPMSHVVLAGSTSTLFAKGSTRAVFDLLLKRVDN